MERVALFTIRYISERRRKTAAAAAVVVHVFVFIFEDFGLCVGGEGGEGGKRE